MLTSQYLRIERKAGGVGCSDRALIRAALDLISPLCRGHQHRTDRQAFLRAALGKRKQAVKLATH